MSYRTNPETVLDLVTENEAHKDLYINDEVFDLDSWVEIYNPNDFQVNLSSYIISNSEGQSYTLPNDSPFDLTIEADGFLLLWPQKLL